MGKKISEKSWTNGNDFDFKNTPGNKRTNTRRQTLMVPQDAKKYVKNIKGRRYSIVLKRLDCDSVSPLNVSKSPISRRTRRKSLANIKSNVDIKSNMKRTISEKLVPKKNSPKNSPPKRRVLRRGASSSQHITKEIFYNKSPVRPGTMASRLAVKSNVQPKKESVVQKTRQTKRDSKLKEPTPKKKSPKLKKSVKRLQNKEATPVNPPPSNRRLTRSSKISSNKKVSLSGKSPNATETYRKTPMTDSKEKSKRKYNTKKLSAVNALLFTPKPDEPYDLLKRHLKSKISSELRAYKKKSSTELNGNVSHSEVSFELSSNVKASPDEEQVLDTSSTIIPSTPLSSRKAIRVRNGTTNLLSSTPVRQPFNRSKLDFEHTFDDITELNHSTDDSECNDSFTESLNGSGINSSVQEVHDAPDAPQPKEKKSYCVVM